MEATMTKPKVGDILRCSWGWDQTNVDWYEVIKTTPSGVRIRKINGKAVDNDRVVPVKGSWETAPSYKKDDPLYSEKGAVKRVRPSRDGYAVTITDYASAYLWDGKPAYETPFNCGH